MVLTVHTPNNSTSPHRVRRRKEPFGNFHCGGTQSAAMLPIACEALRAFLEDKEDTQANFLVLDCRSFLAFHDCRISSAYNAYCPSLLRRRIAAKTPGVSKKVPLSVVVPSQDVRDSLVSGQRYSLIVLYDENTTNAHNCPNEDIVLKVVARCLLQEAGVRNIRYLEGGIQRFRMRYPHLCVGTAMDSRALMNSAIVDSSGATAQQGTPTPAYEQGDPVEILPHLYLGSAVHAANMSTLQRLGLTALLNVSRTTPPSAINNTLAYKCIPVDDSGSAEIGLWFHDAIDFIDTVKNSQGKVLVHCHAGVSRSATICLAYLMYRKRLRLDEAYEYVKTRRSVISPNFNFMGQLLSFEEQLFPSQAPTVTPTPRRSSASRASPIPIFSVISKQREGCGMKMATQRFVFDVTSPDEGYATIQAATPLVSPLTPTTTPILSPS